MHRTYSRLFARRCAAGCLMAVWLLSCSAALGQVDPAVQTRAAGITVNSGDTPHNVADEIPKLDAMRAKVLAAISAKTDAKDYNIAEELKTLEKLDRYSSRLADLVAITDPKAKEVVGWLQANAAVAGTWREAYIGTAKFADNTRLAELKAIETRLGRKLTGSMANDIKGLRAIEDSAASSAAMQELGQRVRVASGLASKEPGIITLGLRVQPAAVNAGEKVATVVALALGGESVVGAAATEQVILELGITGPKSFNLGTLKKMYAPGASVGTTKYFTIDTKDLPEGTYTASLSATDTHGHSLTATDTFHVGPAPVAPVVAADLSPTLVKAFEKYAQGSGLPELEIFGEPRTHLRWGSAVKSREGGLSSIDRLTPDQHKWFDSLSDSPVWKKTAVNGHDAYEYKGKTQGGSPEAYVVWINNGRYCSVQLYRYEDFTDDRASTTLSRAREMARNLDDAILAADKGLP